LTSEVKFFKLVFIHGTETFLSKNKFFYGWVIVGLSMVSMAFWFGIRTTFSAFFVALIDYFHWGRAEAAGAQSIAMFVYMIMAPIIGTLVDRIGPRKVILPGIILTGLGLFLCTQIQTLIQFYLFFGAGWGVSAPMFMSITGDLYKGKNFGLIYGMVEGVIGLGSALGAWIAGYIFDQTQNYFWALFLAILLNLIFILLVWLAAPRKFHRPHPLPF
jgi:MFS family permease